MSILVGKNTKLLVQGITGGAGSFHAKQMIEYGTNVVGGVTPTRGGEKFEGKVPVFDTVAAAAAIACAHLGWRRAVEAATATLLWVAALGGLGALVLALGAGIGGGVLWLSVPAACALLLYRRWRSDSRP